MNDSSHAYSVKKLPARIAPKNSGWGDITVTEQ